MYKQGKLYTFAATGYLYSLIIVDLYRKLVGTNVESIRNMVYIFFFALLLVDMYRSKHMKHMMMIGVVTMFVFALSILINPGYSQVYSSAIFLFISRLWPAYYIGRFTKDWDKLSRCILLFSPIALAYSISLFVIPDIASGQAYATIASNLAFVSMISLFACIQYKKFYVLPIAVICLIPVFFYGTRAFFVGVIISLFLAYLINSNNGAKQKRVFLLTLLTFVVIIFLLYSESIFGRLYQWFPDSRTLQMMDLGDFMDDSNRSSFYDKIFTHLSSEPFSMLGLIGDRIYLSPPGADASIILSEFSHNCCLELCMDFGVPLGVFLNIYFIRKLYIASKLSFKVQNTINYIYVLILGTCFLNMMVSASFMGDYVVWFLFGLALKICLKNN